MRVLRAVLNFSFLESSASKPLRTTPEAESCVEVCIAVAGRERSLSYTGHGLRVAWARAVAAAASAQAGGEPTVVWMGVTGGSWEHHTYHRLWSDGRIERRLLGFSYNGSNCSYTETGICLDTGWIEVPPPPSGNGFACRSDINGDRIIDGADLTFVLNAWGQEGGCEPDATYPCLDLGNLAGDVAMK
jgi:hypothetical protein